MDRSTLSLFEAVVRDEGRATRREIAQLRDDLARVLGLVQELHAFWLRFTPGWEAPREEETNAGSHADVS